MYIDGSKGGSITAPTRKARITDLEVEKEHSIQLQAVSLDGTEGPMSDALQIPSISL